MYNFNPTTVEEAFQLPSSRAPNRSFKPGDESNRESRRIPEIPGLNREFLCHNNKPAKQRLKLGEIYKGKIDEDTLEKNNDILFDVDDFNKALLESQGNTGTTNTLRNALASAGNA